MRKWTGAALAFLVALAANPATSQLPVPSAGDSKAKRQEQREGVGTKAKDSEHPAKERPTGASPPHRQARDQAGPEVDQGVGKDGVDSLKDYSLDWWSQWLTADGLTAAFTAILALAALAQLYVVCIQGRRLERSLEISQQGAKAAQQSAEAATKAAQVSEEAMQLTHRPWLGVVEVVLNEGQLPPFPHSNFPMEVRVRNSGSIPARGVTGYLLVGTKKFADPAPTEDQIPYSKSIDRSDLNITLIPPETTHPFRSVVNGANPEFQKALTGNLDRLWICGTFEYSGATIGTAQYRIQFSYFWDTGDRRVVMSGPYNECT